ncbi:MAG: MmcQ/YjbR family DNA-binding protein [Verrucomicrobiales bacterium]
MELDEFVTYCLSFPGAVEEMPFGPEVLVYKVGGKMFALAGEEEGVGRVNLKGDPERNVELREEYEAVLPGYHMNKRHWNTLVLNGSLPSALVRDCVRESYDLVFAALPKKLQAEIRG